MLFAGLILFVFLIIIRPQDYILGLRGLPLVFIVMGAVLSAWLFSPVEKNPIKTTQDKYYLLLFIMMSVSTLQASWIQYSIDTFVETLKLALIFMFIATIVNTEERFKSITWIVMFLMTGVAGMGVLQYYDYDIVGNGMQWASDKLVWQIRGAGNFDNPNDLAYSVVLTVPFALGAFLRGGVVQKTISIVIMTVSTYCIYLTNSRGGQLALVFSLAVFIIFWVDNPKIKKLAVTVGLIVVLMAFSMQTGDYRKDESSMGRVEAWEKGMELLQQHPLLGVGKDQFLEYHKRDTHNSYVRAGAEMGLPGLFAFVGVLLFSMRNLLSLLRSDAYNQFKHYIVGLFSFLGGYAVASIFSTRTYDIVFLTVVALSSALCRIAAKKAPFDESSFSVEIINRQTVGVTIGVLLTWKIFLIQVW